MGFRQTMAVPQVSGSGKGQVPDVHPVPKQGNGIRGLIKGVEKLLSLVGRFRIFSTIYSEKCRLFFKHFFTEKNSEIFKAFHPFSTFFQVFHLKSEKW
jgi:hypothetical protein